MDYLMLNLVNPLRQTGRQTQTQTYTHTHTHTYIYIYIIGWFGVFSLHDGISTFVDYSVPNLVHTHTHTHTHIYIYIRFVSESLVGSFIVKRVRAHLFEHS